MKILTKFPPASCYLSVGSKYILFLALLLINEKQAILDMNLAGSWAILVVATSTWISKYLLNINI
jgi:hypothetical protein